MVENIVTSLLVNVTKNLWTLIWHFVLLDLYLAEPQVFTVLIHNAYTSDLSSGSKL
jgi:hypothetical protein